MATDDWLQPNVGGGPPDGVNELDHKSVDVCIAMYLYCICTANQSIFVKAQKAGSGGRQSSPAAMQSSYTSIATHLLRISCTPSLLSSWQKLKSKTTFINQIYSNLVGEMASETTFGH